LLHDLEDFARTLQKDEREHDPKAVDRWIEHNAGPLPADDMPRRVADVIAAMIAEATASRHS
jgi:hypothetical protein